MSGKRFECVIFDMDGTLLYTLDDITKSLNITLREFGYPEHTEEKVKTFINNGAYRLMELALPEDKRDEENVKEKLARYIEVYSEHVCEKTRPYDGITELVDRLKKAGIKLAVVSNKPDKQAKMLAGSCFGEDAFEYVSGTGEGLPTKPDKECVDRALSFLNVDRKNTLYVGDSYVDVLTAQNSGIPCAGVLWGFAGVHSFDEYKPDYKIATADELEELIFNGNK